MVSDRAFIFHIYIPWGKIPSIAPKSRSSVKVKYQGHSSRKKNPLWGYSCFTNTLLLFVFLFFFFSFCRRFSPSKIFVRTLKSQVQHCQLLRQCKSGPQCMLPTMYVKIRLFRKCRLIFNLNCLMLFLPFNC